jgi:multiple antibiotic resistance protein
MFNLFINTFIKFFFILTPFFLLSTFISVTKDYEVHAKKKLALRITITVIIICFIIFLFGNYIFSILGITIDSFRIGTGVLLFLTSITLVNGTETKLDNEEDIAVVPLAIPITVGPGTIGALMVMSVETQAFSEKIIVSAALLISIIIIGLLLYISSFIERLLGKKGISVLSKITGLIIAALAAQIVMTGVKNIIKM